MIFDVKNAHPTRLRERIPTVATSNFLLEDSLLPIDHEPVLNRVYELYIYNELHENPPEKQSQLIYLRTPPYQLQGEVLLALYYKTFSDDELLNLPAFCPVSMPIQSLSFPAKAHFRQSLVNFDQF